MSVRHTVLYIAPPAPAGAKNYYLGGNAMNRIQRGLGWVPCLLMALLVI